MIYKTSLLAAVSFISQAAASPAALGTYQQFAAATYSLVDTYTASNFFSSFSFFTAADPTNGFVSYQSQANAQSAGLINTNNNQIYMGVDHTTVNPASPGRKSVRVTSNKAYNHGLFIADIAHSKSLLRPIVYKTYTLTITQCQVQSVVSGELIFNIQLSLNRKFAFMTSRHVLRSEPPLLPRQMWRSKH